MKSILDRDFRYVPARVHDNSADYLKAKFKRIRREIEKVREIDRLHEKILRMPNRRR